MANEQLIGAFFQDMVIVRKALAALPRTAAWEKRAGQWRCVPPYASPRIGDHVGWRVQRTQCVIEELAVAWQYLCAGV